MQRSQSEATRRELSETLTSPLFAFVSHMVTLSVPMRAVLSLAVMGLLTGAVLVTGAPNPNMILVAGLVACATLLGYVGGSTAALAMACFTLYFFSDGHDWVTFTSVNLQKVLISFVGILIVTFFVCMLEHAEHQALDGLFRAMERLKHDNELLAEASGTDTLTGLRNRFSLRRDYEHYMGQTGVLRIVMIDLDNFKSINDENGHEFGDYVLSKTGAAIQEAFGSDYSYRYGGDEFLVITEGTDEIRFRKSIQRLIDSLDALRLGEEQVPVRLSVGYVVGTPTLPSDLRQMFRQADKQLYEAKARGKNQIAGGAFDRKAARVEEELDGRQSA